MIDLHERPDWFDEAIAAVLAWIGAGFPALILLL